MTMKPPTRTEIGMLRTLRADMIVTDLSADTAATLKAMDARWSFSSTRVALTALRKEYPENKVFIAEMKGRRDRWRKIDDSQTPSEKQEDKFVKWEDLLEWRDSHWADMNQQEQLLLSLYTMTPPVRLDYTPMKIVARKPVILEEGTNYVIVRPKSMDFLFHAYKTHHRYGDKVMRVPVPLQQVIRDWITTHPANIYLLETGGKPWPSARLGEAVITLFNKHHSLNTSVSMLRHSYDTHIHRGQKPLTELTRTAAAMMHGPMEAQRYRFLSLE